MGVGSGVGCRSRSRRSFGHGGRTSTGLRRFVARAGGGPTVTGQEGGAQATPRVDASGTTALSAASYLVIVVILLKNVGTQGLERGFISED